MTVVTTDAEERRYAELQGMALDFARKGEVEPLSAMLRHGLPVNLADSKGNTLLMLACYHGDIEAAALLLTNKADVDRRNRHRQTPLGGAAFKGYAEIASLLLDYGADINADNGLGMTPLMFATIFGRSDVVTLLESRGALRFRPRRSAVLSRLLSPFWKRRTGAAWRQP